MGRAGVIAFIVWQFGSVATFIKLTFFDGYIYTWWNWIIVVPINLFLGEIWPIYWAILRPLLGGGH
jgi:hypothetical protein